MLGTGTHGGSKLDLVLICISAFVGFFVVFCFGFFHVFFPPTNVFPEPFRKEGKKCTFIEHLAWAWPYRGPKDFTVEQDE